LAVSNFEIPKGDLQGRSNSARTDFPAFYSHQEFRNNITFPTSSLIPHSDWAGQVSEHRTSVTDVEDRQTLRNQSLFVWYKKQSQNATSHDTVNN